MKTGRCRICLPLRIGVVAILLLAFTSLVLGLSIYSQIENLSRQAAAEEYHNRRWVVLQRIEDAVESGNTRRIARLEKKYQGVTDLQFVSAMAQAKRAIHEKERQQTFLIGKILDIARQREAQHSVDNRQEGVEGVRVSP